MNDVADRVQGWIDELNNFDLWESICAFFKENEQNLIAMNQQQLTGSLDPYGNIIYGIRYPADLYRTGAFYQGMTIETDDEKIAFTSTDVKWEHYVEPDEDYGMSMTPIKDFWGEDVLGIPVHEEEMVSLAMADRTTELFRKCFD